MKKLLLLLGSFLLSLTTYAAMNISKIDPPFWFTGMNNPELQLICLLYTSDAADE